MLLLRLRSIAPAIQQEKNFSSSFLLSFYWASLTFRYLCYSSSTTYALNNNSKNKTLFAVPLAGIRVYSRGIAGITEQQNAFTHALSAILQSRDFILRVDRALKNYLSTKLISQKLIR